MTIKTLIEEALEVAGRYNLKLIEIDRSDNNINLKLLADNKLFIQILW